MRPDYARRFTAIRHNAIMLHSIYSRQGEPEDISMADATRSQLEEAYRLIQQEDLDGAITILRPVTSAQPNNVDAWWLLANAVSEPDDAFDALRNVLRINPNHGQAKELLSKLEQ